MEGVTTTLSLHRDLVEWDALVEARVDTEALERRLEAQPA